ncbi:MAG TPA: trans-aconitate 2-methyltransferase [Caulobacteraceae bacterium]|jgi:trans-aconitate 2-methyltransferase|nr:trans-aconitate 2-methyltransferase [Caulobacteraceae bacterium]
MSWSAQRYVRFEAERTRPVRDLLGAVPLDHVHRAVDLGCGPGNSTQALLDRYPEAEVSGFDSSPDMIAAARARLPDVRFEEADATAWTDRGPFDLILANALYQWIPGHERIFPDLIQRLSPGGALAIQMPDNLDEPSHALMRKTASSGPWAARLASAAASREALLSAAGYYRLLSRHAERVDVWRTTYQHPLAGHGAVVAWVEATGLRPFFDPLEADQREAFKAAYERELEVAYPALDDGTVLLAFPRLFIVAVR